MNTNRRRYALWTNTDSKVYWFVYSSRRQALRQEGREYVPATATPITQWDAILTPRQMWQYGFLTRQQANLE